MATDTFDFWDRVDKSGDCWIWQGPVDSNGYGRASINSRSLLVHRLVFVATKGPIPAGLQIDHLCNNRPCCNPDHLEAVTGAENMRRGAERRSACSHGHPYTPDNTRINTDGQRSCVACIAHNNKQRTIRNGIPPRRFLSSSEIQSIRDGYVRGKNRWDRGNGAALATQFSISYFTLLRVINRQGAFK